MQMQTFGLHSPSYATLTLAQEACSTAAAAVDGHEALSSCQHRVPAVTPEGVAHMLTGPHNAVHLRTLLQGRALFTHVACAGVCLVVCSSTSKGTEAMAARI